MACALVHMGGAQYKDVLGAEERGAAGSQPGVDPGERGVRVGVGEARVVVEAVGCVFMYICAGRCKRLLRSNRGT